MFQYWAKTGSTDESGTEKKWHALPYHLLDVAAAADALWETLPPCVHQQVAHWLNSTLPEAKNLVVFLSGSHDVGKANRFFQAKVEAHAKRLNLKIESEKATHGQATAAYLSKWLQDKWSWPKITASAIALAVGGHHGCFPKNCQEAELRVNEEPWATTGKNLLNELERLTQTPNIAPTKETINPFVAWLAGFVSVADWIGSHYEMTAFIQTETNLDTYFEEAKSKAKTLVDKLGFTPPNPSQPKTLAEILKDNSPNPMQTAAAEVAQANFRLAIIEAPTGEGKTEAAFALAEPARAQGRGIYFALPTMATANGLLDRVAEHIGENVRLAHSMNWLYQHEIKHADNGPETEEQTAEDWFAAAKRALLQPYGVGTVDQPLIGAILAKHFFVRLFALTGKVVVVDEIHAYDIYMSRLIETLLAWLKALDCQVVLLSATLPKSRRQTLLNAWGAQGTVQAHYPCITWVDQNLQTHSQTFTVQPRKPLAFTLVEPESALNNLINQLRQTAGCAAYLCNTVNKAVKTYREAKALAQNDVEVLLFHARFTNQRRSEIEKEVLAKFGPENRELTKPTLLIATQVVEQSLDLDFDHMVSELAPVDLLIQRAGRLHRHKRDLQGKRLPTGNDARPNPNLNVLRPTENEKGEKIWGPIYDAAVQFATLDLLENHLEITEPIHVANAVDQVYERVEKAQNNPETHGELGQLTSRGVRDAARQDYEADMAVIDGPDFYRAVSADTRAADDDEISLDSPEEEETQMIARTRLEKFPSLSLVILAEGDPLAKGTPNKEQKRELALRTVRISVPKRQIDELKALKSGTGWSKVKALRNSQLAMIDATGCFETISWKYQYDKETGLTWAKKNA